MAAGHAEDQRAGPSWLTTPSRSVPSSETRGETVNDVETLATADIVVVGGGIVGLTTAFELRRRGYDVVVVEQRFAAFGASGRNPGAIWLQTRRAGLELELARAGVEKYDEYIAEIGNTFDFRKHGGLFFYETDEQAAVLTDYVADRRAAGLSVEFVDRTEALKLSAFLPDTAIGAVYCEDDAQLDPNLFVNAVASACVRMGVRTYENTAVLSTLRQGDAVSGIRTVRGEIHAPGVVWATGAWAVNLRAEGISVPIETSRMGEVVTQPIVTTPSPVLRGPRGVAFCGSLTDLAAYTSPVFRPPSSRPTGSDTDTETDATPGGHWVGYDDTIAQNRGGSLFIGSSIDGRGSLNPHITLAATRTMIDTAVDRYAEFAHYGVTGLWAGLMSETPDHLPIVDRMDGVYVNAGHSWGMASGPICGQIMADIVAGEPNDLASGLRVERPGLSGDHIA